MPIDPISAGLGAVQLVSGKKGAQSAQGQANKLTDAQLQQIMAAMPYIKQLAPMLGDLGKRSYNDALQYDPEQDVQSALRSYDVAANQSLTRDYGNAQLPLSLRGFTAGNASTTGTGIQAAVAAGRATDRARIAAGLRAGNRERKSAALANAAGVVGSSFNTLGGATSGASNLSAQYQGQANSWDPSGSISMITNGLKGWSPFSKAKKKPIGVGNLIQPNQNWSVQL